MALNLKRFLKLELLNVYSALLKPRSFRNVLSTYNFCRVVTSQAKRIESGAPVYKKTDHEYKISKKATIKCLENLLNIKTLDALNIILESSYFQYASTAVLKENYSLYKQKGVTQETLLKYPEVLTILDSDVKLNEILKLPYDVDTLIILIVLSKHQLMKFVYSESNLEKSEGKIAILSKYLKISPQQACEYIANKPFLIKLSTSKLKTNMQILLNYGVTAENICNDLWVLKYSENLIKTRLELAKKLEIDTMKTWMVRAQEKVFQIHVQRKSDNKTILGDNSLAEYLSERLQCSVTFANYLILKQPSLKKRSLKKMKELIDFMYAQGFTSRHICRVPKILVHSVETISKRLKQLEEKGIQIDSLSMLTKSQNQYMQSYEALVKNKNKAKTKNYLICFIVWPYFERCLLEN